MDRPRYVPAIWSIFAALLVVGSRTPQWWHPYCDTQADGPGYYAMGAPFPYVEPTGASSLSDLILPLAFALDVILLTVLFYLVVVSLVRLLPALPGWANRIAAWSGSLAFLLLAGSLAFVICVTGEMSWSLSDGYFSYRPAVLVVGHGSKPCYM